MKGVAAMIDSSCTKFALPIILSCCFLLGLGAVQSLTAADVNETLKQVNTSLRNAEKDMFAGKNDNAIASLENIQNLLIQAKGEDPSNTKVQQAEKKFQKLVKDLERRTGKDLGGGTLTAASASTAVALPEKPVSKPLESPTSAAVPGPSEKATIQAESAGGLSEQSAVQADPAGGVPEQKAVQADTAAKLPHQARQPFDKASRGLTNVETLFTQLDDPEYRGDKEQLVSRLESALDAIRKQLDEARQAAAEKGVTSHPSFDAAEAQLVVMNEKAAVAKEKFSRQQGVAKAQAQQIEADVQQLKEEYDRLNPILGAATGTVIYYNDLPPVRTLLDQLTGFEAKDRAPLSALLTSFAGKYGSTQEVIDRKASEMGYVGEYYSASYHYLELSTGLEKIAGTRTVMAEDLARKAKEMIGGSGKTHDFYQLEQYEKAREYLDLAQQFDGKNSLVQNLASTIDQDIAAGMEKFGEKIDKLTLPKQASDAPDDAKKLAKTAKEWFEKSPDWGSREQKPYTILAVVVTGPWSIQKKNILDEPIMYGLPVAVAVQKESDKKNNLARVFSLTLRTKEMRGVKMEPPFDYATVGGSSYIRPGAI